jgi:hypothetical protein
MRDPQLQNRLGSVLLRLQITIAALVAGCTIFLVIAVCTSGLAAGARGQPLVGYVALAFGAVALLGRTTFPGIVVAAGRRQVLRVHAEADAAATADSLCRLYSTKTIMGGAIIEGATFFLLVAYLVEGWLPSLIAAGALIVVLALHMPTRSRLGHWLEDQLELLERRRLGD